MFVWDVVCLCLCVCFGCGHPNLYFGSIQVYVGCGPLINVETLPEYSAGWEEDTFSSFLG